MEITIRAGDWLAKMSEPKLAVEFLNAIVGLLPEHGEAEAARIANESLFRSAPKRVGPPPLQPHEIAAYCLGMEEDDEPSRD